MSVNGLKILFIQSEIIRVKSRIKEYENVFGHIRSPEEVESSQKRKDKDV